MCGGGFRALRTPKLPNNNTHERVRNFLRLLRFVNEFLAKSTF